MIQDTSCECATDSVDIFSTPPTQTTILKRTNVVATSPSSLNEGDLSFYLPALDEGYWNLHEHSFDLHGTIERRDGQALGEADDVGFVNSPLHSLFSQVEVYLNEKLVSNSSNTYPYKAHIEKLLSYSSATKDEQYLCELFTKDTAGHMDAIDGKNDGLVKRIKYTKDGCIFTMKGSLHSEILRLDRYLLSKCSVKINLIPNREKFYLMASADLYKVRFTLARFQAVKMTLSPTLINQHNMQLMKTTAKYPIRRGEIKTFSIPKGNFQIVKEGLFTGQLPRRLIVGLVDAKAFAGTINKNPFNFRNYKLKYLCAQVNGENFPTNAIQPDFENNNYLEAYQSLFNGIGIRNDDRSIGISRDDYPNGYSLYIINITPGDPDEMAFGLIQNGSIRLEMQFKDEMPETSTAIIFGEYDNMVEIDRDRTVIMDY